MSGFGVDWEEDNGLAAEYVLGLLTPEEHRLAEERMGLDPDFRALVARWQAGCAAPIVVDANDDVLRAAGVEHGLGHGLTHGLGHGLVHGSAGRGGIGTVFALLGMPSGPDTRQAYFLQLLLPYLHLGLLSLPAAAGAGHEALSAPVRPLSGRELAVLDGVRTGRSNEEVARQLGISALTVKNHLQRSYRALGVANRAHAVARCLALRLL